MVGGTVPSGSQSTAWAFTTVRAQDCREPVMVRIKVIRRHVPSKAVISASIVDLELELVWSTTGQDRFYSNFTITVPASPFCVVQEGETCTEQLVESLLFGGLVCRQVLKDMPRFACEWAGHLL
jgi:hypothetical protein